VKVIAALTLVDLLHLVVSGLDDHHHRAEVDSASPPTIKILRVIIAL
jgi:hypothetical protein